MSSPAELEKDPLPNSSHRRMTPQESWCRRHPAPYRTTKGAGSTRYSSWFRNGSSIDGGVLRSEGNSERNASSQQSADQSVDAPSSGFRGLTSSGALPTMCWPCACRSDWVLVRGPRFCDRSCPLHLTPRVLRVMPDIRGFRGVARYPRSPSRCSIDPRPCWNYSHCGRNVRRRKWQAHGTLAALVDPDNGPRSADLVHPTYIVPPEGVSFRYTSANSVTGSPRSANANDACTAVNATTYCKNARRSGNACDSGRTRAKAPGVST